MSQSDVVADFEGPFWDYSARMKYLSNERDSSARLCARKLMAGSVSEAMYWAQEAAKEEDAICRANERYDLQKAETDGNKWVGWPNRL